MLCVGFSVHLNAQVVLSDTTFNNSDWSSVSLPSSTGGTAGGISFGQINSGGNPGSFMSISVSQQTKNVGESNYALFAAIFGSLLEYNPSTQGAITSVSISVDLEGLTSSDNSYVEPFFEQNGDYFYSVSPLIFLTGSSGWITYSGTIPSGSIGDYNADEKYPDGSLNFTSSGGLITFGIGVGETSGSPIANVFGVDNIKYTLTTIPIPEPSAYGMLSLGIGLVCFGWRRRKQRMD